MAQCTPKSFDLTGKVALITGASYGIGMAIAKAMAANGATIVFNDIKQELVDKGIPFDQFIVAKTPAGRWGEAEDLGGPAVFLASEASDFVNGLILYVDGGILAYIGKQPQ